MYMRMIYHVRGSIRFTYRERGQEPPYSRCKWFPCTYKWKASSRWGRRFD
jgi:hypothetical protein